MVQNHSHRQEGGERGRYGIYEPHYGAVSVCVEGTVPAGDWIRRRRRRATERRRAGKRRIELSLNENFVFQISTANCIYFTHRLDQARLYVRGGTSFFATGFEALLYYNRLYY